MLKSIFLFFLCLCSFFVQGDETVLEIEQNSPDKQKAVQAAIRKVSFELMEQLIEATKLKEQKKQIQRIISTSSNRYILYTKTGTPVQSEKEDHLSYVIPVTIGFSKENLKKILLEEDLFYSGTSHLRILPLILFEDLIDRKKYGWWRDKKKQPVYMQKQISQLYNQIQQTMMPYGFFLINPEFAGNRYFIPDDLLFTSPKKKDVFRLARFFQSHLVMVGSIKVRESDISSILNIKTELVVYHTDSGRVLAEVERFGKIQIESDKPDEKKNNKSEWGNEKIMPVSLFLESNKDFAKGLGIQLRSIYEAGQISSNLLKITVRGKMSYKDSDKFKQLLTSNVSIIKSLQENIIKSESITYIASTSASIEEISKEIEKGVFPGFHVRVSRVKKNEVTLKVVPTK